MHVFHLVFLLIVLAAIAYEATETWLIYRKAPAAGWLAAFKGSATIVWAKILLASGLLVTAAAQSADYFNDPQVADAIRAVVQPEYVPVAIAVIGFVVKVLRNRSLPKT